MTWAQMAIMLTNRPSDVRAATSSMAERSIVVLLKNIEGTMFYFCSAVNEYPPPADGLVNKRLCSRAFDLPTRSGCGGLPQLVSD